MVAFSGSGKLNDIPVVYSVLAVVYSVLCVDYRGLFVIYKVLFFADRFPYFHYRDSFVVDIVLCVENSFFRFNYRLSYFVYTIPVIVVIGVNPADRFLFIHYTFPRNLVEPLPNPANFMDLPPANPTTPSIPLAHVLTIISDQTRWRILDELLKGEPLPVKELARRLSISVSGTSKHCITLLRYNIVSRGFGNLYKIREGFLVPGQRALDFGAAYIRLDRLDQPEGH